MEGIIQKPETRKEYIPKKPMTEEEKEKYLSSLPAYLLLLHEGENIPVTSNINLNIKPDWVDMKLICRGQKFGARNEHGLNFVNMISLILFFANPQGIKTMIYTGKAITLFKAYKRYVSTGARVASWYETDLWDPSSPAYKNIKYTRDIHESVRQRMREDSVDKTTLRGQGIENLWTEFFDETMQDIETSTRTCPIVGRQIGPVEDKEEYFSQMNMVMTQFGFVAFPLLYPEMYGIHGESEDDFKAFIHLWKTIGYMIGIEDRFNLCNAPISEVRRRCKEMITHWVKPSLACVTHEWSHMGHMLASSVQLFRGTPYALPLLFLLKTLDIQPNEVLKKVTFRDWCDYYLTRFLYSWLCRITFIKNYFVRSEQKINKQVRNASTEQISRVEKIASHIEKKRN